MELKDKKILLTGYGFIGKALHKALKNEGAKLKVIDARKIEDDEIEFFIYSDANKVWDLQLGKPDIVIHLASPSSIVDFNKHRHASIFNSLNGFSAVSSYADLMGAKFVYPSTSSLYGVKNDYAKVKGVFELISESFFPEHLRPRIFAGYGPGEEHKGDKASIIFQWLLSIKHGEKITIWGDGSQSRDFIYIDDIVKQLIELIKTDSVGCSDIGTGITTSFNDIISIMKKVTKVDFEVGYTEKPFNYLEKTQMEGESRDFVSLEEGIRKTWEYILDKDL